MILPQFGFIVAQAGADSHTLLSNPTTTTTPNTNPTTITTNNHSHSLAPLLTSAHKPSSLPFVLPQAPFYSRQSSPLPPNNNTAALLPPLLPPPVPFNNKLDHAWYSSQQPPSSTTNHPLSRYVQPQPLPPPPPPSSISPQQPTEEEEEEEEEEDLLDRWQGQYNDLMSWMDNEFWEQADEIYQEKITNLQQELKNLQKGTHSVYKEIIADIELEREKTIMNAEYFMNYQLSFIEKYFDKDIMNLEKEYESEKRQIQESLITSLEDRRKQLKEDQEQDESKTIKRNLRKRNHDSITVSNHSSIKEQPTPKKRAVRPSTLLNIYSISPAEEEELEHEFLNMKKLVHTL
ncbi:hypothetical protein G6F46_010278 [Rhizopus delemar]|uniref:Uncharacterized protein n=1 Tax=Rhizopus delemar TaxID=936053 RepID=A0A9P7CI59_9FUNG|nr:hypothetical protein G6F55_012585 [Rhizopus delemar]KAG1614482.1 hypothetical protein G6F45_012615 [Rhizopus arrhizus]KAG1487504.1 hypothetical protein G6F54_012614 [Rhizopus delemar]KAG1494322.1 hypothetical protein G6F53_012597 [Rhizopus delemar]KAG1504015.1 hypothetical protein G6F52_012224 [Rhizopus delemar]